MIFKAAAVVAFLSFAFYIGLTIYQLNHGAPEQKLNAFHSWQRLKFQLANLIDFCGINRVHELMQSWETFGVWSDPLQSSADVFVNVTSWSGVDVVVYRPASVEPDAASVIFYHGGLFWLGQASIYHSALMQLASNTNFIIVSVSYRRSLASPFPAAYEDVLAATKFYLQHEYKHHGASPTRVALMGDDVGASLAVSVALSLRTDVKANFIKLLILWNPVLQALDFQTPSMQQPEVDHNFNKHHLVEAWMLYLLGERSLIASPVLSKVMLSNDHVNGAELTKFLPNVNWRTLVGSRVAGKQVPTSSSVYPSKGNPFLSSRFTEAVQDVRFSPLSAANDTQLGTLPPSYVITCDNSDPVGSDADILLARLQTAQVNSWPMRYHNCSHFMLRLFDMHSRASVQALHDLHLFFAKNAVL